MFSRIYKSQTTVFYYPGMRPVESCTIKPRPISWQDGYYSLQFSMTLRPTEDGEYVKAVRVGCRKKTTYQGFHKTLNLPIVNRITNDNPTPGKIV